MKAVTSKLGSVDKKAVKGVIAGTIIGIISTIFLTVITALIITIIGKLPEDALQYVSLGVLGIGSLIGGYIAARIYKSSGLIIGLLTGLFILIIVLVAGLNSISYGIELFTLVKLVIILLFSTIGSIIGVNKKERIRYK